MNRTHLAHAILALIDRRGTTAAALAQEVKLTGATISRACAGERLSVDSLRTLCTKQTSPRDGLDLLLAHLRDEVDRAGRSQTEVTISADEAQPDSDIRLLEEQARDDAELAAILHDIAQMVRSVRRKLANSEYVQFPRDQMVAEPAPANSVDEKRSEGATPR